MEKEKVYETLNRAYFSEDKHEKEIIDNLYKLLKNVTSFVDIGASLGQYTFFANQVIRGGYIIAVEPDPIRFEELERNCSRWEVRSNNKLTAIHGALADQEDNIKFYTTESNISGGLFQHKLPQKDTENSVTWKEIEVSCFQLDSLCKDRDPDIVKIDVEGAELRVLKGSQKILERGKTKFLIELHGAWTDPEGQRDANDVIQFMQSFHYHQENFYGRSLFVKRNIFQATILRLKTKLILLLNSLRSRVQRIT